MRKKEDLAKFQELAVFGLPGFRAFPPVSLIT
jgi:hypothetical protein